MTKDQIVWATILTARSQIGVREIGTSNTGKEVQEYQASTPLGGTGWSWCDAFQSWDMLTTLGQPLCDLVWLRTASCDESLGWGRRESILSDKPVLGAKGLIMGSENDAVHIFDVDELTPTGFYTVEGNTNDDGSANGNGVYRRHRVSSNRYRFLHWMNRLPVGASLPGQKVILPPVTIPASPFDGAPTIELHLGTSFAGEMPKLHNLTWAPAWKWAKWFQVPLAWSVPTQSVFLAGREVPAQPLMVDGRAWLPVAKMAAHLGLKAQFDGARNRVDILK